MTERIITDRRHAVGNDEAGEASHAPERVPTDRRHAVPNGEAGDASHAPERAPTDRRHAVPNGDAGDTGHVTERGITDRRHAVGNGDRITVELLPMTVRNADTTECNIQVTFGSRGASTVKQKQNKPWLFSF